MWKRKSTAIAFPLAKLETRHYRFYDLTKRNTTQNTLNFTCITLIYRYFSVANFFLLIAVSFV